MDEVFRALADPTRRSLLDELFREDGQTLSALEARLPMTRFGVMKHLRVLEEAGLVVTRRRGREKLHFLNPVPIRLVHDRWVSKYAEPWAATLSELKHTTGGQTDGEGVRDLHQDHARSGCGRRSPTRSMRREYTFGVGVESDWTPGSSYEGARRRAARSSPARTSRSTRRAGSCRASTRSGATTSSAEGTSRVTWEIEPVADSCRLTVTHDQLREGAQRRDLRRLADDPLRA